MLPVGRVWPRHSHRGRPLNSVVRSHPMLREISAARQISGEPARRWFTSPNIDLFVWLDDQNSPTGFQLCYDKQQREHALTWTEEAGFSHMAVDGGEARAARYKGTPILLANGAIDAKQILEDFRREAQSLPVEFVQLVAGRIKQLAGGGEI